MYNYRVPTPPRNTFCLIRSAPVTYRVFLVMAIDMTKSKMAATIKTEGGISGRGAIAAMKKRAPRDIELVQLEVDDLLDFQLSNDEFNEQVATRKINGTAFPGMLVSLYKGGDLNAEVEYFCFPGIFERSVQEYQEVDDRFVKTDTPRTATRCRGNAVDAYQSGQGNTYDCFKQLQGHRIRVAAVTPVTTLQYGGGGLTERNVYELVFDDTASADAPVDENAAEAAIS